MKFGPVALEQAKGKLLAHNIAGSNGRRTFRKGRVLTDDDLAKLREMNRTTVYVAELDEDDVDENSAAQMVAEAVCGDGLRLSNPAAGRVNLIATEHGVLRVDSERLLQVNHFEGVTVATQRSHSVLHDRDVAATIKIIPFAVAGSVMAEVRRIASGGGPLIYLDALTPTRVGFILTGSSALRDRLMQDFLPLRERVEALGSTPLYAEFVALDDGNGEAALAGTISDQLDSETDLIVLAGETAVMDPEDMVPRAIKQAGGQVECVGAPVEPGNLLMLAYVGNVPILSAPGCARSRKKNIVDWILPRLLAGERMTRADIVALGLGGLLNQSS